MATKMGFEPTGGKPQWISILSDLLLRDGPLLFEL